MESNSISLKDVWAKTDPFQSILTHSTLSGLIAQVIWNQMPEGVREELAQFLSCTQEQVKAWLGYLVSLHDIGKVEELFQWQWPEMRAWIEQAGKKPEFADTKVRHERTTAEALNERIWKELGAEKSLRSFYAGVLGAHHQGKVWGDRIFEKCGIGRDERGDGGKTLEIRGKRRLSARDGSANYQQS